MESDVVTLPAHWAPALLNGDISGLADEAEIRRCRATAADMARNGWSIVDCAADARFTWHYRQYDRGSRAYAGDVLDFIVLRPVRLAA